MEKQAVEKRTTSILDEYAKSKLIFLDTIYETQRGKDDQYKRILAYHDGHVASLLKRMELLATNIDHLKEAASKHTELDAELLEMIDALNRAALHAMCEGASVHVSHDVMLQAKGHSPFAQTASQPAVSVERSAAEVGILQQTVDSQRVEIDLLRKALDVVVTRAQSVLETKTRNAVEEILNDARSEMEKVQEMRQDPHLMRAAEQRRQDLAAISSAQHEIDRLQVDKDNLIVALRKAEQDVVQMRLKMLERDSSMAIINKRIKLIEAKLLEETSTSSKRIEDAERLAGEVTKKYEAELKRLRSLIDQGHKERDLILLEVQEQKRLVQVARDDTEEAIRQIDIARLEGIQTGKDSLAPSLHAMTEKYERCEQQRSMWEASSVDLQSQLDSTSESLAQQTAACEKLQQRLSAVEQELDEVSKDLAQRMQGPFGCAPPRTPASRGESENGILTVTNLIDDVVEKTSSDPKQAESAIRRLSTRLAKVQSWSSRSDKAKHPSVAGRVSSAIHDLAAAMLTVATAGVPPPPTPQEARRRQSRRESNAAEGHSSSGASLRAPNKHESSSSSRRESKPFSDDTVILAGSPNRRSSRVAFPSAGASESTAAGPFDSRDALSEDDTDTPSSSDNDADDDFFRGPPKVDVSCQCVAEVVCKAVQADGAAQKKAADASAASMRRSSTKLVAKSEGSTHSSPRQSNPSFSPLPGRRVDSRSDSVESVGWTSDVSFRTALAPPKRSVPAKPTSAVAAIIAMEDAVRQQLLTESRRFMTEIENSLRSNRSNVEQLIAHQHVARSAAHLKEHASAFSAFADSKQAEAQRSLISEARDVTAIRDAILSVSGAVAATKNAEVPQTPVKKDPSMHSVTLSPIASLSRAKESGSRRSERAARVILLGQETSADLETRAEETQFPESEVSETQRTGAQPPQALESILSGYINPAPSVTEKRPTNDDASDVAIISPPMALTSGEAFEMSPTRAKADGMVRPPDSAVETKFVDESSPGQSPAVEDDTEELALIIHAQSFRPTFVELDDLQVDNVDGTVTAETYNRLLAALHQSQRDVTNLVAIKDSLASINERTHAKLEVCFNTMDDGGKRLLSHASHLPMFTNLLGGDLTGSRSKVVRVHTEADTAEVRMMMELVHWFLLEGQRLIATTFLPKGRPIVFEGRAAQTTSQSQERLSALLEAMRAQKAYIVEEAQKRAMRRKNKKTDMPAFLESPDVDGGLEVPSEDHLSARDDDEVDLEPLENNALIKRVHLSPRGDVRSMMNRSTEDEDDDSDEDTPFVAPIVPRLNIPVNASLQKLELEALVQPLLRALKKKLTALRLESLLDDDSRVGVAVALESAVESTPLPPSATCSSVEVVELKSKCLRAVLSYETGTFLKDTHHHSFFHSMFNTFPKALLQKLTTDFSAECAFQLVLRLTEWWDSWSKQILTLQESIEGRKTDQLRRLIEVAENLESVVSQRTAEHHDDVEASVPDIAAKARRRDETMQRLLEHPPTVEFSLQSKTHVTHQTKELNRMAKSNLRFRRAENPIMTALADAANVVAEFDPKVPLVRTSPVPTVATLSPAPLWNVHAKKPAPRWEGARLPPLK